MIFGVRTGEEYYMQEYDFSYLSEHLPEPKLDCTMCFIEICEHAAIWVETKHHKKEVCYTINNQVSMIIEELNRCENDEDKQWWATICDHVIKGGIATGCHENVECFEKQIYDEILDCISPKVSYYKFDLLFPECLNHHNHKSSLKYRGKQMFRKHTKTVLREYKRITFF